MNVKMMMIPIVIGALGTILKGLVKGTRRGGNQRARADQLDFSITKISQNTEKSPRDLRRLAIPQTPEKDHPLMLV